MAASLRLATAVFILATASSIPAAKAQFGGLGNIVNKAKDAVDSVKQGQPPKSQQQPNHQSAAQPNAQATPVQQQPPAPNSGANPPPNAASAPPASSVVQSIPAASTGNSFEFTRAMYMLMTMRDIPQYYGDQYLVDFATQQVSLEQTFWKNISGGNDGATIRPPTPSITFEWQKLIDQQPALAGGPLLDVFLYSNPDWSFLDSNPKWDPNAAQSLKPVVGVTLFSREKVEGRQPQFAAQELLPVVKRQFEMLAKKLPAHFYFTEQLPGYKYDFGAKAITFQLSPQMPSKLNMLRPVYDPETKTGLRETFNQLPAKAQAMAAYDMVAGGEAIGYQVPKYDDPPQVNPGARVGSIAPEFAWKQSFSWAKIPQPRHIALDRQLQIGAIPMDPGRAEQLVKLGGVLTARIYFTADHIELEQPGAKLDHTTPTVLYARVEKVEILDRNNALVATLQPENFSAPKTAAASTPAPASAKPATPVVASSDPTVEANRQQVERQNALDKAKQDAVMKQMYCESDAERRGPKGSTAYKNYYDQCMAKSTTASP